MREVGKIAAEIFDEIIIRQDKDLRGRDGKDQSPHPATSGSGPGSVTRSRRFAKASITSNSTGTTSTDNMGIPMVETIKLMVFGRDYKQGLQNAYRQLQGVEVFAPVRVAGDDRGDGVRYFLAGVPVQLIDKPVEKPSLAPAAAPAKTA